MGVPDGFASHGDRWTTPDVCSGARDMSKIDQQAQKRAETKRTTGLPTEASYWMTPSVSNAQGNEYTRDRGQHGQERLTLAGQAAQHWPTPTAALTNDGEDPSKWMARAESLKEKGVNGNGAGMPLTIAAKAWPTPNCAAGANSNRDARGAGGPNLHEAVEREWPTPASRDYRSPNLLSGAERGRPTAGEQLPNFVAHHFSPPVPDTLDGPTSLQPDPSLRRRLNPIFVNWLMGWPLAWTIAVPSASSAAATASWHCALQRQLSCFFGEQQG